MGKDFFISDTHWGHANILTFTGLDGKLIRPGFSSVEEMDQTIIDNWNRVVGKEDRVFHGGDVTFTNQDLHRIMPQLNGKKILILGNHDKLKIPEYLKYFSDIRGSKFFGHVEPRFVLTHYPIHSYSNYPKYIFNVHGHIHEKEILAVPYGQQKWFNISVERLNYTPISMDDLLGKLKELQEANLETNS